MNEEKRRTAAIHNFYKVYRELKQYESLRLHTRTELGGELLIEITRYSGGRSSDRILRVSQKDEAEAYEQATEQLEDMLEQIKKDGKAGQRGA